ncbi:MAG: hypothetical protein AAF399_03475 [Bacteroidota bacterium]
MAIRKNVLRDHPTSPSRNILYLAAEDTIPMIDFERYKTQISLEALLIQQYGFQVKTRKSSRHHRVMVQPQTGETLVLHRDRRGIDRYFNPADRSESGSVVDVVYLRCGKDWEATRRLLDQWLNEHPEASALLPPVPKVLPKFELQPLENPQFLQQRGIISATLGHPAFQGQIFAQKMDAWGRKTYYNTAFPCRDLQGNILGVEVKNHGFKGHALHSRKGECAWYSATAHLQRPIDRIILTESALDALSFHQLMQADASRLDASDSEAARVQQPPEGEGMSNSLYLSTGGAVVMGQLKLVQELIDHWQPKEVFLAFDRDEGGLRHSIMAAGFLKSHLHSRPIQATLSREGQDTCLLEIDLGEEQLSPFRQQALNYLIHGEAFSPEPIRPTNFYQLRFPHTIEKLQQVLKTLLSLTRLHHYLRIIEPNGKDFNEEVMQAAGLG